MNEQSNETPAGDMVIEIRTDSSIAGSEALVVHARQAMEQAFTRFSKRITRIDMHLSDANGGKGGGDDKHCNIEVRLAGRDPVAASARAATLDAAIRDATHRMKSVLERAASH